MAESLSEYLWLKSLGSVNTQGPQDDDNRAQKLSVSWASSKISASIASPESSTASRSYASQAGRDLAWLSLFEGYSRPPTHGDIKVPVPLLLFQTPTYITTTGPPCARHVSSVLSQIPSLAPWLPTLQSWWPKSSSGKMSPIHMARR